MRRFILDTGIAGLYLDRRRGVFERAAAEVARGNRVGIASPVLGELAYRAEGSPLRDRNLPSTSSGAGSLEALVGGRRGGVRVRPDRLRVEDHRAPIGQNDIMIAAVALTLGNTTVVTMDADLASIPRLTVANWADAL